MRSIEFIYLVLAILSIIYGLIVASVGSGTLFYMVWLFLGAGFLALAFLGRFHIWQKVPGAMQKIILLFLAAGILLFIVVEACIISQFHEKGEADLDYIIVLGAQVRENGPSVVLKYRLDTALQYLSENPDTKCIVTGAQGYNEPYSEAQGMADYLQSRGIAEDRIIKEDQAENTSQNISYSYKLIDSEDASVGIITNNFHMYRALMIAGKQGLVNVCGISAPSTLLFLPNNCLREFLGVVKDFVR